MQGVGVIFILFGGRWETGEGGGKLTAFSLENIEQQVMGDESYLMSQSKNLEKS